jgi:glycerol-3-phosphate acyltransferase PlsY
MTELLLIAGLSYLLGSIPFGYLLVRIFRGEDIRRSGSGNIGATNVSRSSPALGVATLLLDALKGSVAVIAGVVIVRSALVDWGTAWRPGFVWSSAPSPVAQGAAVAALFAILGHMFPVWLRFHGGKGVATGLGAFVVIAPKSVLAATGVFLLVVAIFRYVSLASIAAVSLLTIFAWALRDYAGSPVVLVSMAVASLLIVGKHHENIRRLMAGTENRIGSKRA